MSIVNVDLHVNFLLDAKCEMICKKPFRETSEQLKISLCNKVGLRGVLKRIMKWVKLDPIIPPDKLWNLATESIVWSLYHQAGY